MALIEHTLEGEINKVDIAIQRIKSYEEHCLQFTGKPYYVAYSGGKDSDCIRILCELAGVKYDLVHNHTTVDAPETVRYVRSIPDIIINYPEKAEDGNMMTMWKLIVKKHMPPTRIVRYCCEYLKERGGRGRFVITGVRWAESNSRKARRGGLEVQATKMKDKLILNADNADNRRLFESCQLKGKRILNPIIDWSDADVWEFLMHYGCKSNPLYQCGYMRVGCVGCPMSRPKRRKEEFIRYPKFRNMYIRTFDKMIADGIEAGKPHYAWKTGQDVFDWWMEDVTLYRQIDGQIGWEDLTTPTGKPITTK